MVKLSVIIVNYNVKFFLEQCLISVQKASEQLLLFHKDYVTEVFVVDNSSVDSSVSMVSSKFPKVHLIDNKINLGFAKANNQALRLAKGAYCLLLNPDTVIEENTFVEVIRYMDQHQDTGALGVKMIDGSGRFLPESKRAFPSPMTAFYKVFGFSRFLPHSKRFGKYHLSYLDENEINEVDVLSGAFMLLRKSVLDKIGLFDESFFMYGEDIDLSYRIKSAGYKNIYFPLIRIIHYKGESTKKSSVNYVFVFYQAMIIFARKHFSPKAASWFSLFINMAIYFRASLAIFKRFFIKAIIPICDLLLMFLALLLMKNFWETNAQFGHGRDYPPELTLYVFPVYVLLWLAALLLLNTYKKPYSTLKILKAILLGTVFISAVYAFFEESFRFSRALILLGTFSSFFSAMISRFIFTSFFNKRLSFSFDKELRIAIVGHRDAGQRILDLLDKSDLKFTFLGFILPLSDEKRKENYLGNLIQMNEIIKIHKVNELIFCAEDVSSEMIIKTMSALDNKDIIFKIAPPQSLFIIGSHDKNQSGDLYTIDIKLAISTPENRINKRILDIGVSLLCLLLFFVFIPFQKKPKGYFRNIFNILRGDKSWVGYIKSDETKELPLIRKGVLHPGLLNPKWTGEDKFTKEINLAYARDYSLWKDAEILIKNLTGLGS